MLCVKNLVNALIDFLNFSRAKDRGVLKIRANVLALHPVAFVEIHVAVSICLIAQPTYGTDQFSLNCLGLSVSVPISPLDLGKE